MAAATALLSACLVLVFAIGGPLIAIQQNQAARTQMGLRSLAEQQKEEAQVSEKNAGLEKERALAALKLTQAAAYANQIQRIRSEWQTGDPALAVRLLNSCRWQNRGWEHHYLYDVINRGRKTWQAHSCRITAVEFSPDGSKLVSADENGIIHVWDTTNGEMSCKIPAYTNSIESIVFAGEDNSAFYSLSNSGELKQWTTDGELRIAFPKSGESPRVTCISMDSSTSWLIVGLETGMVRFHNGDTFEVEKEIRLPKKNVNNGRDSTPIVPSFVETLDAGRQILVLDRSKGYVIKVDDCQIIGSIQGIKIENVGWSELDGVRVLPKRRDGAGLLGLAWQELAFCRLKVCTSLQIKPFASLQTYRK